MKLINNQEKIAREKEIELHNIIILQRIRFIINAKRHMEYLNNNNVSIVKTTKLLNKIKDYELKEIGSDDVILIE